MKKCPQCGSTVADRFTCRICGKSLSDVVKDPDLCGETFARGPYLTRYLLKKSWICVLAAAAPIAVMAILGSVNATGVCSALLGILSVAVCVAERRIVALLSRRTEHGYALFRTDLIRYLCAAVALTGAAAQLIVAGMVN